MPTTADEQAVATRRRDDAPSGLAAMAADTADAWLRHYEAAELRRRARGAGRCRPISRRRRQRVLTAAIVAGLFVACALLGAFIF